MLRVAGAERDGVCTGVVRVGVVRGAVDGGVVRAVDVGVVRAGDCGVVRAVEAGWFVVGRAGDAAGRAAGVVRAVAVGAGLAVCAGVVLVVEVGAGAVLAVVGAGFAVCAGVVRAVEVCTGFFAVCAVALVAGGFVAEATGVAGFDCIVDAALVGILTVGTPGATFLVDAGAGAVLVASDVVFAVFVGCAGAGFAAFLSAFAALADVLFFFLSVFFLPVAGTGDFLRSIRINTKTATPSATANASANHNRTFHATVIGARFTTVS